MARISMNEVTTYRWSFEEDVARYRAAGFEAIGVWRQKLSDVGDERGAEILASSGLRASNLSWAGGFTGSDGRSFSEAVEDAQEAVRLAGRLGCRSLVVYAGSRGGHTKNHARRLLVSALRELAPLADACQVRLALEPMHPNCAGEFTFLTSIDETLDVIADAQASCVQLTFDTFHMGHDPSLLAKLPQWTPQIALVQLGDTLAEPCVEQNRCRLGEGIVPLTAVVQTLQAAGYDGDYDIELRGEGLDRSAYDDLLQHSRRYVKRLLADDGRAAG